MNATLNLKNTIISIAVCAVSTAIFAQNTSEKADTKMCIQVQVSGLQAGQGHVLLAAYDRADAFLKAPWAQQRVAVTAEQMTVSLCGASAPAELAVTGFQDLNGNNKMDANPIGIPTEPYGASGTPPQFSAPTWATTKVAGDAAQPITVKM